MKQWLLNKGLWSFLMEWCCIVLRHNKSVVMTDHGQFIFCVRCQKAWH